MALRHHVLENLLSEIDRLWKVNLSVTECTVSGLETETLCKKECKNRNTQISFQQ